MPDYKHPQSLLLIKSLHYFPQFELGFLSLTMTKDLTDPEPQKWQLNSKDPKPGSVCLFQRIGGGRGIVS